MASRFRSLCDVLDLELRFGISIAHALSFFRSRMLGVVRSLQGLSFGEIRSFPLAFIAPGTQIRCKQFSFFLFLVFSPVILLVLEL